jgi:hypothetical protein
MKSRRLELAVIGFCAWQASSLLTAWRHSPFDRLGWLSFAIWLAAAVVAVVRHPTRPENSTLLAFAAVALALLGRLLDLNALLSGALALSVCSLVPGSGRRLLWLAGAISWMPALGWLAHGFPSLAVAGARVLLALAAAAVLLLPIRRIPAV